MIFVVTAIMWLDHEILTNQSRKYWISDRQYQGIKLKQCYINKCKDATVIPIYNIMIDQE